MRAAAGAAARSLTWSALAAEPEAITWAGIDVDTLFICLPDLSLVCPGGNKTVFIVMDQRSARRAQFSVCGDSVSG